jgi:hypothetical protein
VAKCCVCVVFVRCLKYTQVCMCTCCRSSVRLCGDEGPHVVMLRAEWGCCERRRNDIALHAAVVPGLELLLFVHNV